MYIVMFLNGQEMGRNQLLPTSRVSKEMEELKNRFHKDIERAGVEPMFYIESKPSILNKGLRKNLKPTN